MTERERTDYEWDWLGNQVGWDDDASSFYERSLGTITNGRTEEGEARPSALYLATNIDSSPGIEGGWDGAGWVEVDYGDSGNVESFTVHGECTDTGSDTCTDVPTDSVTDRASNFRSGCTCGVEQHYSYRWDELNRLVDARRYDRVAGDWVYQTRLRYRYDAANQRTVEESFAHDGQNTSHRVALTVYPGHFERRGLERGSGTYDAQGTTTDTDATETQYMVAGARIVWDAEPDTMGGEFDRNRRATVRVSDLLGTSSAVLDIESRELLEMATYYPSGARENLWTDDAAAPLEPIGFTGKEADEEIGAVYFGERWLIPRLGRWATPDPLHVHASGGGEALNSYHYVSGNFLQATDPVGLDVNSTDVAVRDPRAENPDVRVSGEEQAAAQLDAIQGEVETPERRFFARDGNAIVLTTEGLAAWALHVVDPSAEHLSNAALDWMSMIVDDVIYETHVIADAPSWVSQRLDRGGGGVQLVFPDGGRDLYVPDGLNGITFYRDPLAREVFDRVPPMAGYSADANYDLYRSGMDDTNVTVTFTVSRSGTGTDVVTEGVVTSAHESRGHALMAERGMRNPLHLPGPAGAEFEAAVTAVEQEARGRASRRSIGEMLQDAFPRFVP